MSTIGKDKAPISCIKCDVCNCIHNNHNCGCTKSNIQVGPTSATTTNDTICKSFEKQCCN